MVASKCQEKYVAIYVFEDIKVQRFQMKRKKKSDDDKK